MLVSAVPWSHVRRVPPVSETKHRVDFSGTAIVAERIDLFTTKNTLLSTSYKKYIKNKDIKKFVLYISLIFCTLCHSLFLEIIKLCFILYFIGKNCEMNYVVSKDPISQLAQVIEILQAKH